MMAQKLPHNTYEFPDTKSIKILNEKENPNLVAMKLQILPFF